jgi:hypothetical protein
MPLRQLPDGFQVAFSFAGARPKLVRAAAEAVENELVRPMFFSMNGLSTARVREKEAVDAELRSARTKAGEE